jgi:hypothetical protein
MLKEEDVRDGEFQRDPLAEAAYEKDYSKGVAGLQARFISGLIERANLRL